MTISFDNTDTFRAKIDYYINGFNCGNTKNLKYIFLGESRIGFTKENSIRIKREDTLIPKFILKWTGWTEVNYKNQVIWVNNASLRKRAHIVENPPTNIKELFNAVIYKIECRKIIEDTTGDSYKKMEQSQIIKSEKIVDRCLGKKLSISYIRQVLTNCLDKKSVHVLKDRIIIQNKELMGKGVSKEVYKGGSIDLEAKKTSEIAYITFPKLKNSTPSSQNYLQQKDIQEITRENKFLEIFKDCEFIADPMEIIYQEPNDSPLTISKLYKDNLFNAVFNKAGKDALSVKDKLSISTNIAQGLAAIHKQGLVHGDIKLCNILLLIKGDLDDYQKAVIGDLGTMGPAGKEIKSGTTYIYMAPEIFSEMKKPVKNRSIMLEPSIDIWATGIVLSALFYPAIFTAHFKEAEAAKKEGRNINTNCMREKLTYRHNALSSDKQGIEEALDENSDPQEEAELKEYLKEVETNLKLVNLIEQCTKTEPKERITAEALSTELSQIFSK